MFIPAAGVPWFVTLFGRDSLVVSMQGIGGYPEFAAGALRRLSTLQATDDDPERDMEPGKIPHEIRHGELAQLRILPFQPYYGTHDATSLFVIVISYLYQWLGDVGVLTRYLPNAEAAMRWIDRFGDRDGDGFQEYKTRSKHGYYNQGWKDAGDAIPNADGSLASLPLALCELQGYAYDAKLRMADIYDILGQPRRARASAPRRTRCSSGSTTCSGGRRRGPTTSGSTARSGRSNRSRPMPAIAWPTGSCRPIARRGSSSA